MSKVLSFRASDEDAAWAGEYAKGRGVTRQALLEEGLRSFREDCERGVPEIREAARKRVRESSVGSCPKSPHGHSWAAASVDSRRSCVHCGRPGRDHEGESGGFFAEATMARAELFSGLRFPLSSSGAKR